MDKKIIEQFEKMLEEVFPNMDIKINSFDITISNKSFIKLTETITEFDEEKEKWLKKI